jgi:PAS domain S-box-containing protein
MASTPSFFTDAVRALSKGLIFAAEGFRDNYAGLRDIVDAMDLAMAVCSRDLSYIWASNGIGRLLERPREEIIGRPIVEVIGETAFKSLKPYFDRVLAGEYVEYQEEVLYRQVGRHWIHAMYAPTHGPDRAVDGWVGLILNVDEERRAQERARESEGRFRRLADSAPVLMWMGQPDGSNTFINAQYAAYSGLSQKELRNNWKSLIHPDDRESYLAIYFDAVARGVEWHQEIRFRRYDGVYRWFEVKGVPRYEGAQYVGYIGCSIDVTERRTWEEATRQENQEKDQLIAVLGHELRNPMGAISNAIGILEKIEIGDDTGRRALTIARWQLNGLGRLGGFVRGRQPDRGQGTA